MTTATVPPRARPRYPRGGFGFGVGFWVAAYAELVLLAFSTAPSPLYALYASRDHFSSLMITLVFAAYAIGVLASLFLVSHRSDVRGRRPHLLAALGLGVVAIAVFLIWPTLAGLFLARILTGVAVGLTMSTATAYITELHQARDPDADGRRAQVTVAVANLGGMALGALLVGLLAQYAPHPLQTPYLVLSGLFVLAALLLAAAPETRPRQRPLPAYRPQRVSVPPHARRSFVAAAMGIFFAYATPAVFIGLSGTFLSTVVHNRSLALAGGAVFIMFIAGVALVMVTGAWPLSRLLAIGVVLALAGLALVVVAAWLPTPSLVLFLVGGGVIGSSAAALFKGTLGSVVALSPPERLGETLAGYYLAAYIGLSIPAVGVGLALHYLSPRSALLAFAIIVAVGLLTALPLLVRPGPHRSHDRGHDVEVDPTPEPKQRSLDDTDTAGPAVYGRVEDGESSQLHAVLTVISPDGRQLDHTHTDAHGHYRLHVPEPGHYLLVCTPHQPSDGTSDGTLDGRGVRDVRWVVVDRHAPVRHDVHIHGLATALSTITDRPDAAPPADTPGGASEGAHPRGTRRHTRPEPGLDLGEGRTGWGHDLSGRDPC